MDVCTVSMRLKVYQSVLAMYGAANALYWKSSYRQNSTHLKLLKHQNTKTFLLKTIDLKSVAIGPLSLFYGHTIIN